MNNLSLVRRAIAGILAGDLRPLVELTAPDAVLILTTASTARSGMRSRGADAIVGYFRSLGAIPTFWQVRLEDRGREVLVIGTERFTLAGGLEGESDFLISFELKDGLLTALRVVEGSPADPPATRSLPGRAIVRSQPPVLVHVSARADLPDGEPHSIH